MATAAPPSGIGEASPLTASMTRTEAKKRVKECERKLKIYQERLKKIVMPAWACDWTRKEPIPLSAGNELIVLDE